MEDLTYRALVILAPSVLILIWQYFKKAKAHPSNLPYLPGPKPLPIIGNLFDVPAEYQWRGYHEMSKKYGDAIFMKVFGQPMLILGSAEVANELLEKRSAVYSDRLPATMVDLMGWDWNLGLIPYGNWWRSHRREVNQYFNQKAAEGYTPIQEQQRLKLLKGLIERPQDFLELTRFAFGASIFKVIYGIDVMSENDEFLEVVEEALQGLTEGLVPGTFWVDYLPWLQYLPSWLPGAEFKKKAAKWKVAALASKEAPYREARNLREKGKISESIIDTMLTKFEQRPYSEYDEEIIKNVTGVGFIDGVDTTTSTTQMFFFAMATHPEIQKRAQAELDEVVGEHRLPRHSDRASLPLVDAIVRECIRWQPVAPLGVAHRTSADDVFRGCFVPKGTVVIANQWAILHDPESYPEPEKFNPDRFLKDGKLDPTVKDPKTAAFGFGRRICPGRFVADNALFGSISAILHVFNITPPVDEFGKPVHLPLKMTSGGLSFTEPFKCNIVPRSAGRKSLVDNA